MGTSQTPVKKKKRKGSGSLGLVLSILGMLLSVGTGVGLMAYADQIPYSNAIYYKIAIGAFILSAVFLILFIVYMSIFASRKEKNDGIKHWLKKGVEVEGTVHEVQPVAKMNFGAAITTDPVKLVGMYQTHQGQVFPFMLDINVLPGEMLPSEVTVFYDTTNPGFYMVEYTNQRKEIYRNTGIPSTPPPPIPLS